MKIRYVLFCENPEDDLMSSAGYYSSLESILEVEVVKFSLLIVLQTTTRRYKRQASNPSLKTGGSEDLGMRLKTTKIDLRGNYRKGLLNL